MIYTKNYKVFLIAAIITIYPAFVSIANTDSHTQQIIKSESTLGNNVKTQAQHQDKDLDKHSSSIIQTKHFYSEVSQSESAKPLTIENIRTIFRDELKETTYLLNSLDQKVSPRTFFETIKNEAPSKIFWDFICEPLVRWLVMLIGTLSIFGKILIALRIKKVKEEGGKSPIAEKANTLFELLSYIIILLFVATLASTPPLQTTTNHADGTAIAQIADRLTNIENLIKTFDSNQPPQKDNINILLFIVATISTICLFVAIFTRWNEKYLPRQAQLSNTATISDVYPNKQLVPPLVLMLVLFMLPYPADTIILPFVLSIFITSFLDLLRDYPNPRLLNIVARRYSVIIYTAYYGAWSSMFYAAKSFLDPLWIAVIQLQLNGHSNIYVGLNYVWQWAPIFIAIIVAIPGWRRMKREAEYTHIPALKEMLNYQ